MMDTESPWDDHPESGVAHADAEWTRISTEFTNAGYREGITAGKESALQEGFNQGFADVGAPIGRQLGMMRGMASAVLAFLQSSKSVPDDRGQEIITEARAISSLLSRIRFSDIMPPDLEAEEHARQHLAAEGEEFELNEEIKDKKDVEGLEDFLEKLSTGRGTGEGIPKSGPSRPTIEDVQNLQTRLDSLTKHLCMTFY